MTGYIIAWASACVLAAALAYGKRAAIARGWRGYVRFLCHPWKLLTGAAAAAGLIGVTPWAREMDYTWDFVNASFMSLLTFTTAPWTVGTLYLALRGRASGTNAYIAVCIWLFSATWSYDLWHLIDFGEYPPTWLPNIFASSCLYIPAGMLWNLSGTPARGLHFAFTEPGWPGESPPAPFWRVLPVAVVLMALAAAQVLFFLV